MPSRLAHCLSAIILSLAASTFAAEPTDTPDPPAPQSQLPPVPACQSTSTCQLPGSDSITKWGTLETLPECHPLPDLSPVLFREISRTPNLTVSRVFSNAAKQPIAVGKQTRWAYIDPLGVRRVTATKTSDKPDALTPIQHLQRAADHLEAAGRNDEAAHIRHQAEMMRNHARQRLNELRQQQKQIQREIKELEQMTGMPDLISLHCDVLELSELHGNLTVDAVTHFLSDIVFHEPSE